MAQPAILYNEQWNVVFSFLNSAGQDSFVPRAYGYIPNGYVDARRRIV